MVRLIMPFALLFYTLVTFGQEAAIPAAIAVPTSSKLISHVYAKGVQVYVCIQDPKDTSRYVWTFKEPRANLYADKGYRQLSGRHYLNSDKNPTWEFKNGSKTTGKKIQQANSPDSKGIPWLLLKAISGNGTLANVAFIQRIETRDGKAPASASRKENGLTKEVPYTAEYLFYSEK
jgi:hypothetical protein